MSLFETTFRCGTIPAIKNMNGLDQIGSNVSSLTIAIVAMGKVEWRRSTLRQFNMTMEKSPCVTGKSSINRP